jgi:hypothetical protein
MGAPDILQLLTSAGLRLSVSGETLLAEPRDRLTDQTRELIRENKPDLLVHLRNRAPTAKPERTALEVLVRSVGTAWAFSPAEVDEALAHALAKPDEARECFEALALEVAHKTSRGGDGKE